MILVVCLFGEEGRCSENILLSYVALTVAEENPALDLSFLKLLTERE